MILTCSAVVVSQATSIALALARYDAFEAPSYSGKAEGEKTVLRQPLTGWLGGCISSDNMCHHAALHQLTCLAENYTTILAPLARER